MSKKTYGIKLSKLRGSECLGDASKEELRVLLCLIADGGTVNSDEELAAVSGVSRARVKSALALWQESGVISLDSLDTGEGFGSQFAEIIDEYEDKRALVDAIDEEESVRVAKDIRDRGLAELLEEVTHLMNRSALSTSEIKNITALYTQLSLSEEYILTLAAHIGAKGKLTAKRLAIEAEKLVANEIDNVERLEAYIQEKATETGALWEMKRLLKISGKVSLTEREMFNRWVYEYGYSSSIVEVAYDIAATHATGSRLLYTDAVLRSWHEAGCRTVEECVAFCENGRMKIELDKAECAPKEKKKKTVETEVPKYSEFNSEDALMRALERSYGDNK